MKNWRVPAFILVLLIFSLIYRWGDAGSTTNNGTTIKTKVDYWNGSIWQTIIKNGSYTEIIVHQGWVESSRELIEKQVEYKAPYYKKVDPFSLQANQTELDRIFNKENSAFVAKVNLNPSEYDYDKLPEIKGWTKTYEMKTKTVQEPPTPMYWLSSRGLTKIWLCISLLIGLWLIITVWVTKKEKISKNLNS